MSAAEGQFAAAALGSAAAVRAANQELDGRLLRLAASLDPARLAAPEARPPGKEAWNAAIVLAHLAEFPVFFAAELRRFYADPAAPVGRTVEHEERLAAIAAASGHDYDGLLARVRLAQSDLAGALAGLQDRHLHAVTRNRKYGPEPLTSFLDRYVLGHKLSHLRQLAAMPAAPAGFAGP